MRTIGYILCPHLKGSSEGTVCGVTGYFIKNMEGSAMKLCMSQRHEACAVYMQSLQNMAECGSYSHCITIDMRQ